MNRDSSNKIRYFMDEWIPPAIRDARWFMYPFFRLAFKGKNIQLFMDLKSRIHSMTDEEYNRMYDELECIGNDRVTHLNKACVKRIIQSVGKEKKKIIDIGCGNGFLVKKFIEQEHEVWACDVFEELKIAGLNYRKGSAEKLPFADKSFDLVVCTHTIEHVRNLDAAIDELKRITREKLIIVTPKQRPYYYTLDLHIHFFPYQEALISKIGLTDFVCENLCGDWYYEATC
jgi:ubiquinone/menaquinone biosynthesis C-methylase UbiE